ncbi:MAG: gamma-glutamylcyclotransferase [Pseudomonadota bacterium]
MTRYFIYGTLLDVALLGIVAPGVVPVAATLAGHGVFWAKGTSYPRIARAAGTVEGAVLEVDETARARLDFYEGGFGYGLREVSVDTKGGPVTAWVYWPGDDVPPPDTPWHLEEWAARFGPMTRHAAREAMEYHGEISAEELAARMPMIRTRAHARVLAEAEPAPEYLAPVPDQPAQVVKRRRPYTNFFSVLEYDFQVPRFDGTLGPVINRAGFVSGDAVVVLPYDPVRDRVMMVEQWRASAFFRGDPNPWVLEPVAGRIDPGEAPETSARREAEEEARLSVTDLHAVSRHYPSTGTLTEFVYTYVGIVDLPDGSDGVAGLESEDENIRSHILDWEVFLDWLDGDRFRAGPLVALGHWLARHREGLRRDAGV